MMRTPRPDYAAFHAGFDPAALEAMLDGDLRSGVNACVECCDRHASGDAVALRWEGIQGRRRDVSFAELKRDSARFANLLRAQGIGPGDRVAGLLPRIPELLTVILGTLRAGAVYQPLFTAFGPKAIAQRLAGAQPRLVVTDAANRPKLDDVEDCPPVVTLGGAAARDIDFHAALAEQPDVFEPVLRKGGDLFLMLFTSGTTGAPKGVGVPLAALPAFAAYVIYGLDLRPEDRYWNIADPGWAYGLYYAVIGPLLLGHATTFYEGPFTVEKTCEMIARHGITNFAGAPTAYRLMIAAGEAAEATRGKLRVASSAGEPLNPEVIRWFDERLGCPLHDHYGQTEIGMALMNHHGLTHPVKLGATGRAMPGFVLEVVNAAGDVLPSGEPGMLAVDRTRSPLFCFPGYLGREGQGWTGNFYLTGDTVVRDADGVFTFVGRSDDVISSGGYRIGPFDVESCLIEHPAVLESAVVGKPDAARGQIVKAFVVLFKGQNVSDALAEELRLHVRGRLGAHAYPREVAFVAALPKTPSGKIQRFLLRKAG